MRQACARSRVAPCSTSEARSTASPRKPSTPPTRREKANPETILLNFEGVDYINSTGIALIVGLLARARASKRPLLASNLSEHYMEIFDITHLSDFMSLFPDE